MCHNHHRGILLQVIMPGFSSVGFHRGNVRPQARVWKTKQFMRGTTLPDTSLNTTEGVTAFSIRAHSPNWVGTPIANRIGTFDGGDNNPIGNVGNANLTYAYLN